MTRYAWIPILSVGFAGCETELVPVTVTVTRPGADCRTEETYQLPAKYWSAYQDDKPAPGGCLDMTWYALTDEGDCWEFSGICGEGQEVDPFIIRNEGDPAVDFNTCADVRCP